MALSSSRKSSDWSPFAPKARPQRRRAMLTIPKFYCFVEVTFMQADYPRDYWISLCGSEPHAAHYRGKSLPAGDLATL